MSDTGNTGQENEAGEGKLIRFAKPNPFDSNGYAALMARMDAALERSRASIAEYQAILQIIKRDYMARPGPGTPRSPGSAVGVRHAPDHD